jgi:threonine dehydrogenase-like Zn-dependent dehydrogenase
MRFALGARQQVSLARGGVALNLQVCLFGCGVTTGFGAVFNTNKVQPGETVAVFGLGAVGLAVVQAARIAGAKRIFAVDNNPEKFPMAKQVPFTGRLTQLLIWSVTRDDPPIAAGCHRCDQSEGHARHTDPAGQLDLAGRAPWRRSRTLGSLPTQVLVGLTQWGIDHTFDAVGGTAGRRKPLWI